MAFGRELIAFMASFDVSSGSRRVWYVVFLYCHTTIMRALDCWDECWVTVMGLVAN